MHSHPQSYPGVHVSVEIEYFLKELKDWKRQFINFRKMQHNLCQPQLVQEQLTSPGFLFSSYHCTSTCQWSPVNVISTASETHVPSVGFQFCFHGDKHLMISLIIVESLWMWLDNICAHLCQENMSKERVRMVDCHAFRKLCSHLITSMSRLVQQ